MEQTAGKRLSVSLPIWMTESGSFIFDAVQKSMVRPS